jgi:cytochrome c biogenesis factor
MALVLLGALLPPIVILLGAAPNLEAALYFTAVVMILLTPASLLLGLVFAQRSPTTSA